MASCMESLETLVRFLFCYKRAPDEYTADISTTDGSNNLIQSRTEIAGHAFAFCEVLFEILNILIILNVFAEGGTGGVWVGITLLISMIAGWALTHFGGKRIDQGGIYWAPFFMDSDTYFQDMPRRKKSVKVLSALAFTEVGVFMLQDIPFSVVNGQSGLPYFVDFFEGLYVVQKDDRPRGVSQNVLYSEEYMHQILDWLHIFGFWSYIYTMFIFAMAVTSGDSESGDSFWISIAFFWPPGWFLAYIVYKNEIPRLNEDGAAVEVQTQHELEPEPEEGE